MASVWLVNGLLQYESGKTWFTIALARTLSKHGYRVNVYKPVAGHSAWYQFETLKNSIKYKVLVGEDVVKYKEYLELEQDFSLLNPVDILSAPPSPTKYRVLAEYLAALEVLAEQIVIVRLSDPENYGHEYLLVEGSMDKIVEGLKPWIRELVNIFNPKQVSLESLLDKMYSSETNSMLLKALDILSRNSDILLVESFNDAAVPFYGLLERTERVFTTTPGYFYELDVKEFKRTVRKNYLLYGDPGVKMGKLFPVIDVVFEAPLPIASSPLELADSIGGLVEDLIG